jgi:radical SAM protein with 4Fe4S-binding SPASM domain
MEAEKIWDVIAEIEIDDSWRKCQTPEYNEYRRKFEMAQQQKHLAAFPLSIEIESSYSCNLKCPYCPRTVGSGEKKSKHISEELWQKILSECRLHSLPSILMDHEGEALTNPRFGDMVAEAKRAGILDIWLHTNANLLTPEKSERLIDAGLTKINFSIDAVTEGTYNTLRVGGNYRKVVQNVKDFLRIKAEKKAFYLRVRISFVEQKENILEKRSFFEFWKNEPHVNMITFQECIDCEPFGEQDEDSGLSEKELERKYIHESPFHCSMPWEMPVIDVAGNIIPCGRPVREHTKDFILGNMLDGDTIESAWNGEKMKGLRKLHTKGDWYKNTMCRICVKSLRDSRKRLLALRQEAEKKISA